VTADAAGAIAESNENNNSVTEKLCWEFSLMNGTCSQGAFMPASAAVHSALPIQMGLLNTGLYKAGSANVKFELSGPGITGWLNLGTAGTAIGNNCACPVGVRLNNPYVFSQLGTYTLRVTADPDAEYTECDESNNVLLHQISIYQPRPDYVTRSEFIAPSLLNPDVDEPISIDLSYRNQGVSGTDSFWVYAQVNNDALDSVRVTGMVAGTLNTVHLNRTWSSSVRGVHVIRAVVDHRNDVQENNELNNEATRAIVVGHAPNLLFRSFTVDNPAPVVGTDLALHAVIENAGASDCVATLQFLYKNNSGQDVLITQRSITVDSAGTLAVLANWRVTDAHTRIFARIINGNPLEYNLDDNEAVASVGSMSIALTATPATCGNTADGVIRLAIDGGVAPYQRTWSTGATGDSIVVAPGTYTVTVVDVEGTVRNDTVTVSGNGASCDGITTVVSAASICAGSPVTVSFTAAGTFLGGNQFVAQLSDATGSFASPVTIGTLAAAGSGSISALIPAGTPGGSGYRIRVVSTTPALIGSDNGTDLTISPVSAVNLVNNQVVCAGASLPAITFTGVGSSFAWTNDNPAIGLAASGTGDIASFTAQNTTTGMLTATIRVMALSGSCASKPVTFRISVKPAPTVAAQTSQDLCAGSAAAAVSFTGALPGTTYSWANDNTATGLAARGTGSIPAFTAVNNSAAVQVSIITVTPSAGGCTGTPETFTYTVRPSAGSIAYSGSPYCPSGWAYVQHAGSTGGTYSATPAGLAIDAATGAVNLAISQPGDYTVSYTVGAGGAGCSNIATAALSINASTTVSPIANQVLCAEVTTPPIAFTGTATSYSWTATGAAIGLAASGTGTSLPSFVTVNNGTATATAIVTISPLGNGGCPAGKPITFRISVAPKVVVDAIANQVYCKGVTATGVSFSSGVAGATYSWSRTPAAIGLAPASGAGAIPSFVTQNASASTLVSTVTVTATANKCSSVPVTFQYEVGNCITQSGGSGTGGVPTARIATALSRVVVGPNPTQGKVTIYLDSKSTATYTVRVTDQNGSVLGKTATFTGSSYSLDLGSLAAGTYLVLLADARTGEQVQRKIIKL
ncbi:MAG: T9SS type A sorting domain-containing protein, partial [Chitinophagaceae bacterium]